jgi:DEAD/DEAH box helicase domain-containing protein
VTLEQVLLYMRSNKRFKGSISTWKEIPPRPAIYGEIPDEIDSRLVKALKERGVERLYSHQSEALKAVLAGENIVVVTPTASGKTLTYNLPVLNSILKDSSTRAMYIFPTKALSQDQVTEVHEFINAIGEDIKTYTYDGDTPSSARRIIRSAGHIIVTNPDMLHTGILPHHTKWMRLFENLKYVVVDELHSYRGVFGSHFANVIRRLKRICKYYGSSPQFLFASATIANPQELATKILDDDVSCIDDNGAPCGSKHFIFYNPPVVNKELGIRRSSILETKSIGELFIANKIQNIIFARSRLNTEILLTYMREAAKVRHIPMDSIRGYRGGYLPRQRREIEEGLRKGEVLSVVSTTALELGIDIGRLDVAIISGYPGSVASTWQQAGRAGRRSSTSAAILVGTSSPLDQYIMANPEYFFGSSPESGFINPDNLIILLSHIKCAAFELPFVDGEKFGPDTFIEILQFLEEERILRHVGGKWHWMCEAFPAEQISLRTASTDNVVIVDTTVEARVIGEVDRFGAFTMLHDEAIYIHEGQQYHVERFDYKEKKAYVKQVDVDYYTDAELAVSVRVMDVFKEENQESFIKAFGEVVVTAVPTIFKKIKLHTHENVGWGHIHLPEQELHTTAFWLTIPEELEESFSKEELQSGLLAVSNLFVNIAPLYLMCDPADIKVFAEVRSPFTERPTIYLYDKYPGGIGLAEKLYSIEELLIEAALDLTKACQCEAGCPSCVGPLNEIGQSGKRVAIALLNNILNREDMYGSER